MIRLLNMNYTKNYIIIIILYHYVWIFYVCTYIHILCCYGLKLRGELFSNRFCEGKIDGLLSKKFSKRHPFKIDRTLNESILSLNRIGVLLSRLYREPKWRQSS